MVFTNDHMDPSYHTIHDLTVRRWPQGREVLCLLGYNTSILHRSTNGRGRSIHQRTHNAVEIVLPLAIATQ